MLTKPTRKRDLLKPWLRFRDSDSGEFVTRLYALLHPTTTESIDTRNWD